MDFKNLILIGKDNETKLVYIKPNNLKLGDYISYLRSLYKNKYIKSVYFDETEKGYEYWTFVGVFVKDSGTTLNILNKLNNITYNVSGSLISLEFFIKKEKLLLNMKNFVIFEFSDVHRIHYKYNYYEISLVFVLEKYKGKVFRMYLETDNFKIFSVYYLSKLIDFDVFISKSFCNETKLTFKDLCKIKIDEVYEKSIIHNK